MAIYDRRLDDEALERMRSIRFALALAALAGSPSPTPPTAVWVDQNTAAVTVSLAADASSYSCAQEMRISITLTNRSQSPIKLFTTASWTDFRLQVFAAGKPLQPDAQEVHGVVIFSGRASVLQPGQTWVERGDDGGKYTNTQAWGYALREPLDYELVVVKTLSAGRQLRSNSVEVKRSACD